MSKRVLYLIQQAAVLMQMPRSQKHLGPSVDDVASHSYHVAVIAYCLCRMEKFSHDQGLQAIGMAIFHDLAEARTGNVDLIGKNYAQVDETKAIADQFAVLEFGADLKSLVTEYEDRVTDISKIVKDADSLQQMYLERMLAWEGIKLAQMWFESDFNDRVPGMSTQSAKKLAESMKDSNPNEWWWSQFTEDGRAKNLEHLLGKHS